jgi:hypothetical protein
MASMPVFADEFAVVCGEDDDRLIEHPPVVQGGDECLELVVDVGTLGVI